jgi:glutathione peroxidase
MSISARVGGANVLRMSIYTYSIAMLDGQPLDLKSLQGKTVLVVNVASKCGLTPQYTGLEELQHKYADRGFTVLGVPCNQFGGQEPGTAEEISTFCSSTYGVTFPITEKVDVNGQRKHPLFTELEAKADANGDAGDIQWNFEKFLVSPAGEVVGRFRPTVAPDAEELVNALEALLPS